MPDITPALGCRRCRPFTKWQGSLAEVSSLDLAADVTFRPLAERRVDPARIVGPVLGWSIPPPGPRLERPVDTDLVRSAI
jgi:hypothetical protein